MFKSILLILTLIMTCGVDAKPRRKQNYRRPSADQSLWYHLAVAEHERNPEIPLKWIAHPDPKLAEAALIALGRIGDPSAIEAVGRFLNRSENRLRKAAAFSLSLFGHPDASMILSQHLPHQKNPEVLGAIFEGLGRSGDPKQMQAIYDAFKPPCTVGPDCRPEMISSTTMTGACKGLGLFWTSQTEKVDAPLQVLESLFRLSQTPNPMGIACAFALSRYRGQWNGLRFEWLFQTYQKNSNVTARFFLIKTMAHFPQIETASFLNSLLDQKNEPGLLKLEAMKSLARHPYQPGFLATYKKALQLNQTSAFIIASLETAMNHSEHLIELVPLLENLYAKHTSFWVRGMSLKTLAKISPEKAKLYLDSLWLNASPKELLPYAVSSLGFMPTEENVIKLTRFAEGPDPMIALEAIDTLTRLPSKWITDAVLKTFKTVLEKGDGSTTTLLAQWMQKEKSSKFIPSLTATFEKISNDQTEPKVAILQALETVGDSDLVPFMEKALTQPERSVAHAAAQALKKWTQKDYEIPVNSKPHPLKFTANDLERALQAKVKLATTRGEITLKMKREAPLNALNFVRLAERRNGETAFYQDKTFHRIVPNFVAQGGDPRGDGYGGPGYLVRDEWSPLAHERGTVGIATAGKDTGGSQFFFNLTSNPHLEGRYTLFAEIVSGISVADRLEVGDKILRLTVY